MGHLGLIRKRAARRSAGLNGRPDAGRYSTLSLSLPWPSFFSINAIPWEQRTEGKSTGAWVIVNPRGREDESRPALHRVGRISA